MGAGCNGPHGHGLCTCPRAENPALHLWGDGLCSHLRAEDRIAPVNSLYTGNHGTDGLRELVRAGAATVNQMSQAHLAAPAAQQERFHEVLLGLRPYSPQELGRLWNPTEQDWQPVLWIKAWGQSLQPNTLGGGQVGLPT